MSTPRNKKRKNRNMNFSPFKQMFIGLSLPLAALSLSAIPVVSYAQGAGRSVRTTLQGHIPTKAVTAARVLGRTDAAEPVSLALTLPLQNEAALDNLLTRLYDPADPMYGRYLTPAEFTSLFAPTQADYDKLAAFARAQGLTVVGTHSNRLVLDVKAPAGTVENAFQVHLQKYQAADGHVFRAPDAEPSVPVNVAPHLSGVIGLDTSAQWKTHSQPLGLLEMRGRTPFQIGSGPGGGLTPADIRAAYNLNAAGTPTGTGQTLAVFELDGYHASDVSAYESAYGLPAVPLQNVLVDGYSGAAGSGAGEVTLDIELQIALAPNASRILVYEGPNSNAGVVDTYNRIASDNLAKGISTSWGLSEGQSASTTLNAENNAFKQMAAQGQSIFAASGDSGAYDNGSTLSVDDPASQPYMVGVGGTSLTVVAPGGAWQSETTWNRGSARNGAGGGGISTVWTIPSWQTVPSAASKGSSTMRNVPDVSLNSDQYTGYSIYYNGAWTIYGGTSCAAPLWSAFTACVNQQRLAAGSSVLGFANPSLYQAAQSAGNFHDIADGSTNLYYPAVAGYDDATGLGSFNGASLLAALAPVAVTAPPAAPTGLTASAGNGSVTLTWSASSGAASYNVYRGTISGGENAAPVASGITGVTYTDTGLTNGTTYFYYVVAVNSLGTSPPSNEASATPAAPILAFTSGPNASASKFTATISWSTNLATDSVVQYGTSSSNLSQSASNATLVTSHSIGLSGLARKTTYYYTVSSTANGVTITSATASFRTN